MAKEQESKVVDEFTVTLAEKEYRFRWGLGELIDMQEQLIGIAGTVPSVEEMDAGVRQGRLKYIHAMIWAGLRRHHPLVSKDGVTRIMHDAEKDEMQRLLREFGYSVRPDPKDLAELPKPDKARQKNPRKAQAKKKTNGAGSTSTPDASA